MKSMTPLTTMTAGQINKAVQNYRALLEKHSTGLDSEAVQTVLGQSGLATEQLTVFRRRVEGLSNIIIRTVKVDRNRSPKQALEAIGRVHCEMPWLLDDMPKGEGDEVDVVFFKPDPSKYPNGYISDDDLKQEREWRDLQLADPASVAAVNEIDPTFAERYPHGTHWRHFDGRCENWFHIQFGKTDRGARVEAKYYMTSGRNYKTNPRWFTGIRKKLV